VVVKELRKIDSCVELKLESGLINPTVSVFVSFLQDEYKSAKALRIRIKFLITARFLNLTLQ
jgi:hypothetical protein